MTDEGAARPEPTIADAERIIRKIEACSGMAAKLVLLRNFIEFSASSSNAALVKQLEWVEGRRTQVEVWMSELGAQIREERRAAEAKAAELREELQHVLNDWNDLVKASGSPTNGGAIGHVRELRDSRDRLQEALRELQEKYDRLSNAYDQQRKLDLMRDTDGFGGHR